MRIRTALPDDLDGMHGIVRAAIRHMETQGIKQWDAQYPSEQVLSRDIRCGHAHVLEQDRQIAGVIVLDDEQPPEYDMVHWSYLGRALVVHRLAVHPGYQRRGLAMRLMDFAESRTDSGGYDCIRLDAYTGNPAAFLLYEARGYRRAGLVQFRMGPFYCYEKDFRRPVK